MSQSDSGDPIDDSSSFSLDSTDEADGEVHRTSAIDAERTTAALDDGNWGTPLSEEEDAEVRRTSLGKYLVQERVGRGGMGVVWKAFDPDLHRCVAIKVLGEHLAASGMARRRFQREARAAGGISHPNVLTIHSVEEHQGTPFLVMEYISGQSLKQFLAKKGRLEAAEFIRLGCQIAQGLAAAHAQGVIHRDIKPGNVMLDEGGSHARLSDFGLARVAFDNVELTSRGQCVGTLAYMSPESLRGEACDTRSDLFSLGCVYYQMLTGTMPFPGRNQGEMVHKILDAHPQPPHEAFPEIPQVLSEIVMRLLSKAPAGRYQSAAEIADILSRLQVQLNQTPTDKVSHVFTAAWDEVRRSHRSPRRLKRAALTLASSIAIGSMGVWWIVHYADLAMPFNPATVIGLPARETTKELAPTPPPELAKLARIIVGSSVEADFLTISEAVRHADVGATIEVMGPGPFVETVILEGINLSGVTLVATTRAIWKSPAIGDQRALVIGDVRDVRIEGFDFQIETESGRAIQVSGDAQDVRIIDCSFRQTHDQHKLSLVWVNSKPTDPDSMVHLLDCRFWAAEGGSCLALGGNQAAARVWCSECHFHSVDTHVYSTDGCRRMVLTHNVFEQGSNAVNLSFRRWWEDSRIEVTNNTFVGTRYWLGLMDSFRNGSVPGEESDSIICNNLILGGERVQGGDDQWAVAMASWTFACNWWERDAVTKPGAGMGDKIATLHDRAEILHRDARNEQTYLLPAVDSPLLFSGMGGGYPAYVGARGLQDSR